LGWLKDLIQEPEIEERRLEKLGANLSLDQQILRDALGREW
jgi:hypothetical protein